MGVRHALNPDPYRGAFGNDGPRYAEDVNDLIQSATCGQVCSNMNPIQACTEMIIFMLKFTLSWSGMMLHSFSVPLSRRLPPPPPPPSWHMVFLFQYMHMDLLQQAACDQCHGLCSIRLF